ncbi:MAG: CHAT domain-containing protein [Acidimicrobiales bacterium]
MTRALSESEAWELLDRAAREPAQAREVAVALLEESEADRSQPDCQPDGGADQRVASILWRVVGVALRGERRPTEAIAPLRKSIDVAERVGDDRLRGLGLLSLALAEAYLGQTGRAKTTINAAVDLLHGLERAEARFQRALILQLSGELEAALADHRAALPVFKKAGRDDWTADLLTNRGILHAYRGKHGQARSDFDGARQAFVTLNDDLGVASMGHNMAWLATLQGEVVAALAAYGQAEQQLTDVGFPVETVAIDHCEALNAAGLFTESADRATAAVHELSERGMELAEAETLVVLAEACAHAGDLERGDEAVRRGLELLDRHDNPGWLLRARLAQLRLSAAVGDPTDGTAMIQSLEAAGFTGWSREARILLARRLTARGDLEQADQALTGLAPSRLVPELQVLWWLARAELHRARGSDGSAIRAVRSGVRAVRVRQEIANTSEVRAHVGRQLGALASIAIERAVEQGHAEKVVEWSEELVSTPPPPRQAPTSAMQSITFELRAINHELIREQAHEDPGRRRSLLGRQRALHRRLRAESERGSPARNERGRVDVGNLAVSSGLRCYAVANGQLHCVSGDGDRLRMRSLGSVADLLASLRQLDFQIRSIMRTGGSASKLRRLDDRSAELDRMLGLPGRGDSGSDDGGTTIVVLVPPGLGSIPFGALPSLRGRSILHATSLRSEPAPDAGSAGLLAVAGPDLAHAKDEVAAVAATYTQAAVLSGAEATCLATLQSMEQADIVHFAAHGRRSPDNPFFDSVHLADGPLFTHELEWLRKAPRLAVLASCESAIDHSLGDSQRLGVIPSLDRVGVWRTIASAYPLPDNEATVSVMVELHRRLALSADPMATLAACAEDSGFDGQTQAIARSLVCRGRPEQ